MKSLFHVDAVRLCYLLTYLLTYFFNPIVSSSKPTDCGGNFFYWYQVKWRWERTDFTDVIHPDTRPRKLEFSALLFLKEGKYRGMKYFYHQGNFKAKFFRSRCRIDLQRALYKKTALCNINMLGFGSDWIKSLQT